jgi:hypothetical protein
MRIYFFICFVFLHGSCFSQANSIVGKWKPVHFNLGNLVEGDMSKNNPTILVSIDSIVKNDKDPEASKQMMEMVFQIMFDKTKSIVEEYTADGSFIDTDIKSGKSKKGIYTLDTISNQLIKTYSISNNKLNFKLNFTNNTLIVSSKLKQIGEKESEYIVTYQKL